ncbi:hypothetical protein [Rhizobium sp. MHM7A]|uniref:hypothetical protein n=1 Tax=Rhizobium sp. MHM7A TaxID=2583233 RepID=UPI001106B33C|nr:hypothetical protein [Rhizobium sp. MHM7A]TLX17116.1 hypothetical protein FFR93_07335 [Rhizobium sp. MHM7A]
MKSKRGYDDTAHLMKMATGLADGTFVSVHQAARQILNEPDGPNVDRLRRKYRDFQRNGTVTELAHQEDVTDPSAWWKLRLSDFPCMAKTAVQNVLVFVRSPASAFRKALKASSPAPLMFLLMGVVMITVPGARLAFDIFTGVQTEVLPASLLGIFFAAICINAATVLVEEDTVLCETQ